MYSGQLVFSQLMDHLPLHTFRRCVQRYPSKYPTKTFSHLDQFLCMAFAQLTYRESLRDIETCLRAHQAKLYHLGIRGSVARSTMADANESRDCRIFADLAMSLISIYVLVAIVKKRLKIESSLYTILQILSLTLFEKTPLNQLLNNMELQIHEPENYNQLNLFN